MESKMFTDVLREAIAGDPDAVEAILQRYSPLINSRSRSHIDGKLDEDLRQYIYMRVVMQIPKFSI